MYSQPCLTIKHKWLMCWFYFYFSGNFENLKEHENYFARKYCLMIFFLFRVFVRFLLCVNTGILKWTQQNFLLPSIVLKRFSCYVGMLNQPLSHRNSLIWNSVSVIVLSLFWFSTLFSNKCGDLCFWSGLSFTSNLVKPLV